VEVSGKAGDQEFRFATEEHGDIYLHESQVMAFILRVGEVLADVGSLVDGVVHSCGPAICDVSEGYSIYLTSVPSSRRIYVLKAMREILPDLGLKAGMMKIDNVPSLLMGDLFDREYVKEVTDLIEQAGGTIEIREE